MLSDAQLPPPGTLRLVDPPHWRGVTGPAPMTLTLMLAVAILCAAGLALFGWHTIRVLAIAVAVALLVEAAFNALTWRGRSWSESYTLLVGMLVACTLPPTVGWEVVVTTSALAVLAGQMIQGGIGNYVWHPVALGRVIAQLLFETQLSPARWPVLASERLGSGNLYLARDLSPLAQWSSQPLPPGIEAWSVNRPVDQLRSVLPVDATGSPAEAVARLVSDAMPPWPDTLFGVAGGSLGEAPVLAILLAGLLLTWRGFLRWSTLLAGLAAATTVALIAPVQFQPQGQPVQSQWFPGLLFNEGLPVGLAYVAYQLTAGAFPLVLFILAADPTSSPLTARGHLLFGLIIGGTAMILRTVVGLPAEAYWALLLANTCVPAINRLTRRRTFGVTLLA
ncbi:MAG TPA: RnfABCDGE type electron transport complex subunit D [Phycisphaerae bacterium]|nr:RnfABCDGE type electron transport complex subunit D [Phycisphaerae bacterium]HRY68676.1 RnfABCDGE type electron transport complex subunit D [Phycisphaerae bacterium]